MARYDLALFVVGRVALTTLLTPYLMNLSAMIIDKISNSAFSVIIMCFSPPFS